MVQLHVTGWIETINVRIVCLNDNHSIMLVDTLCSNNPTHHDPAPLADTRSDKTLRRPSPGPGARVAAVSSQHSLPNNQIGSQRIDNVKLGHDL